MLMMRKNSTDNFAGTTSRYAISKLFWVELVLLKPVSKVNFSKISSISHSAKALFEAHTGSKSEREKQHQMKGKDAEHKKLV